MKITLVLGLLVLTTSAFATELPENVLAEHTTHVGFAPANYRGIYRWQILNSGTVQLIDNKNKKTVFSKLSTEMTSSIASAIDRIKSDELKKPNTPPCMDAPSMGITVRKEDGTNMTIWERTGCRDSLPKDEVAASVAYAIQNLKNALSSIEQLKSEK